MKWKQPKNIVNGYITKTVHLHLDFVTMQIFSVAETNLICNISSFESPEI